MYWLEDGKQLRVRTAQNAKAAVLESDAVRSAATERPH
jgi:hypothetical protein